jgi:hypothetical protein
VVPRPNPRQRAPRDDSARARAEDEAASREGRLLVELANLQQELEAKRAAEAHRSRQAAPQSSGPPSGDPVVKVVKRASWRILAWAAPFVGGALLAAGRQALELWSDVQRLKTETAELRSENRALRAELATLEVQQEKGDQYDAQMLPWILGVLEKQGVRARRPAGVEATELETSAPLRRPGRVTPGVALEVKTAPPAPP